MVVYKSNNNELENPFEVYAITFPQGPRIHEPPPPLQVKVGVVQEIQLLACH